MALRKDVIQSGLTGWCHQEFGVYEMVGTKGCVRQKGERGGQPREGSGESPDVGMKAWAGVWPLLLAST